MKKRCVVFLVILALLFSAAYAFGGGKAEEKEETKQETTEKETTQKEAEQVLVGAFDNGPGGNAGDTGIPYAVAAGHTLISKMYTSLTHWDKNQENIVAYGAESWDSNDDFTVWTFTLKDDLMWSDGEDVTADDLKFTAEFVTDPDWVAQNPVDRNQIFRNVKGFEDKIEGRIDELDSVKVLGEHKIQYTLATPDPRYFATVYRAYILPEHAIDFEPSENLTTDWWTNPDKQVGSGPFHVSDYKKDDYLEMAANEYYFNGRPKLDKLVCKYFSGDETASALALAAGDIDFSYINFGDIKSLGEGYKVFEGNSGVPRFLNIMFKNIPDFWKDVRVRKAIHYAIDREQIVENVYKNTHKVIPGIVSVPGAWPDDVNWYKYDPDRAKELLAEAGVQPSQIKMETIGYKNDPMTVSAMQAIQAFLKQIGIEFTYTPYDVPTYRSIANPGNFDFAYVGTSGLPYNIDPNFMYSNEGSLGGEFFGFDYDKHYADINEEIQTASTAESYMDALSKLVAKNNELVTKIYLWVGNAYGAASERVKDFYWYPASGGGPFQDNPEKWYIED